MYFDGRTSFRMPARRQDKVQTAQLYLVWDERQLLWLVSRCLHVASPNPKADDYDQYVLGWGV